MTMPADHAAELERQIDQWRGYLHRRRAIRAVDVAELEDHLREQVAGLTEVGLATDEAFLVAVKRMGDLDELSREFAVEHSDRLWKQLVAAPAGAAGARAGGRTDAAVALGLAGASALAIQAPGLFGVPLDLGASFYARNLGLLVLPFLAGYFAWKRRLGPAALGWLGAAFVAAAVGANLHPLVPGGSTEALTGLHLPVALWFAVGLAYAGGRWSEVAGRMDFIRFSGELLIYYALIALGGGVLTAFLVMMFRTIGIDVAPLVESWLVPCGAAGAVLVA